MYAKSPKTNPKKLAQVRAWKAKKRADPAFREKARKYHRAYVKKNCARLRAQNRDYQRKHALRIQLHRKGLTLEDYQRVVIAQGETCAVCGGPPGGRWKKYNIDHCHKTGRLRGLLCKSCNQAIGLFRDDPALLRRAIAYLRR